MGLRYNEMQDLTWLEFDYLAKGHFRRIERDFDQVRWLIAGMFNSSGFSKKTVKPTDIMKLENLDKPKHIRRVRKEKKMQMLKILEHGSIITS